MNNISTASDTFDSVLDQIIAQSWSFDSPATHLKSLVDGADVIARAMIEKGDYYQESSQSSERERGLFIHFEWAEKAKAFLVLWRDILFEQQKAHILYLNQQIPEEKILILNQACRESVEAAANELTQLLDPKNRPAGFDIRQHDKKIARWKLQQNPWAILKKQLAAIPKQCQDLLNQHDQLQSTTTQLQQIRQLIEQTLTSCREEVSHIGDLTSKTEVILEEVLNSTHEIEAENVINRLSRLENEIEMPNYLKAFTETLKAHNNQLPAQLKPAVETQRGMLLVKEINLRRGVNKWMESEIIPVLYEVWELTENVSNGMKLTLATTMDRVGLLDTEIKDNKSQQTDFSGIREPLRAFKTRAKKWEEEFHEFYSLTQERLDGQFHIGAIYDSMEGFLAFRPQKRVGQLIINQWPAFIRLKNWGRKQLKVIRRFIQTVEQEESLSISEKIVRLIQNRKYDETNSHYTSIFLTKGHIGESFMVGRDQELNHIQTLIDNWLDGYRGAVLVSGERFSGKTLFCESVANRYFPNNTIRLNPNETIRIPGGRSMEATYEIQKALAFIRKYSLNTRPLILIEDLELWTDVQTPLIRNVRFLQKHIDSYSSQQFFIVSTGNVLKQHLSQYLNLNHIFQAEINMDRMTVGEIREAILVRHGATQKTLVDNKGREMTRQQIRKLTDNIFKTSRGNVGEALNQWAFSTYKIDDDNVIHKYQNGFGLPDFISPDTLLVLRALMLEKRTSEYRLRKLFGPAFKDKYGSILQRLIRVGLLTRHLDDRLEINGVIVNDLRQLMMRKHS